MRSLSAMTCIALVALAGCRRDAAEQRSKADKAEEKAQQATLTSGALDENAPNAMEKRDEAEDARDKAVSARAESLVAFRNEQVRYRGRIEAEMARVEPADDARRSLLGSDLTMIDRATEQDWAPLRGELDRHLAGDNAPSRSGVTSRPVPR